MTAKEEIQAIHWATWTSVLGPEVNGIWPKYTQVNDVNATDASFGDQAIVTGDDFGLVKLLRFPCIKKGEERCVCLCRCMCVWGGGGVGGCLYGCGCVGRWVWVCVERGVGWVD